MNRSLSSLLLRWGFLALGVTLATKLVPGIACNDGLTLFVVVILLSFLNAVLRPVLLLFTLPFILVTAGLGIVVINALLFYFVGHIVDGFVVAGFWPAVWGSLVVSITNLILNVLIKPMTARPQQPPRQPPPPPQSGSGKGGGDVIDI